MNIKKVYLNHRTILKISGINPVTFLNNILSSDIKLLKPKEILPSAILSPQGRILFDIMITFGQQHNLKNIKYVLIECDKSQTKCLIAKINKYNLRKEIIIKKTNYKVFVTDNLSNFKNSLIDKRFFNKDIGRIYEKSKTENINSSYDFKNLDWYNTLRYINCVPEGPNEIITNVSLPLEINFDILGGISFEKGCYIGQEVNARMKWRGITKRKYVPIILKSKTEIKFNGNNFRNKILFEDTEIGEILSINTNSINNKYFGIAIIKVVHLYKFEEDSTLECDFENFKIEIKMLEEFLPLQRKSVTS